MMFHNTEKTETHHGNAPQILFGARITTLKSLKEFGFVYLLHKLVFIVSRLDWCARIRVKKNSLLEEKRNLRLEARWAATSNQWNIKMPRLLLVADVINYYMKNWYRATVAGQVNQCQQYWKSLLPATFDFCRKIYCWARTGVQRWWKRWIAQKLFSSKISKKENAMLLVTGFATVSQIIINYQLLSIIMLHHKVCYSWINKCNVTRLRHKY